MKVSPLAAICLLLASAPRAIAAEELVETPTAAEQVLAAPTPGTAAEEPLAASIPAAAAEPSAAQTPETAEEPVAASPPKARAVPRPASEDEVPAELPGFETTVVGKRPPPAPVAASDLLLRPASYRDVPRRSAQELLTLAPGILLSNHQGEGHASAVFLRGFDAGEGQDIEFRLEAVPLNEPSNPHGHGYADTHFIIPELVESVRVVEGPFDPAQGDFAVAGSVEYRLGLPERGLRVQGGQGTYGAQELTMLWGPGDSAPSGTFVGVLLRRGDGFGPARAYAGGSAMAGYEHRFDDRTRLRLVGTSYATSFDSAGVIRVDDYEAGRLPCGSDRDSQFFCAYDPGQGGESSRHGFFATLSRQEAWQDASQTIFFSSRRLRLAENFTGYLFDDPLQRGDGQEELYSAFTVGLRGNLVLRREVAGLPQELEVGYLARYDDGESTIRKLRRPGGDPYSTSLDNALRVTNLGAYAAARTRLTGWFRLAGGFRVDSFFFDVTDRNRPTETRAGPREPTQELGANGLALEPRLTAIVRLADGLDWITSYGVGVRSSDVAALSDGEFAPFARVRAAETGLVRQGEALVPYQARLVAFTTRVDRDLVFDERHARNVFVGASSRYGALAAAQVEAGRWLATQGSFTWTEARLSPDGAGFWAIDAGARLPYVPRWVARVDAAFRRRIAVAGEELPASAAVGVNWIGARPLPLDRLGDPVLTVDVGGRVRWGMVEAGLQVTNLLDARYYAAQFNYASNFAASDATPSRVAALHFAAAPPRMALFTLSVILENDRMGP
ncbi:TonB-dependent receptor domain-containing protein [Vulgatibacter incomptus]|uniref:Nicel/Cobalt-specific TonB-dependent outer membrane receptor n=1 Tax=Vulgatibacter incomptus TaxID=1391653 RepID=A0A0K1PEW6_9BACT|nr:TonB-dependent receptor [Vulgatibacter incomptus]AKU92047.1 Nicel/Cobalt-specific TonB-dependent outer membrane receptor [Vulgatibacter incomptus]